MAYYTALINEWPNLTGTTAQKLATLDAMTVTGSIPTLCTTSGLAIMECLNFAEFETLTVAQQTQIMQVCAMDTVQGGSASFVGQMFASFYSGKLTGPTITALTALAVGTVVPWWQANGYAGPINMNDLIAAGGLT